MNTSSATANVIWSLRGRVDDTTATRDWVVDVSPFIVGRRGGLQLTLPRATVSQTHAELTRQGSDIWVRDLGSTNGTYVNGCPVLEPTRLGDGDLIQFADAAFRVACAAVSVSSASRHGTEVRTEQACDRAFTLMQFDKLMSQRAVVPYFQPIVVMATGERVGYEVLGRSRLWGLQTPKDMFLAASQLNLEAELSRMLRAAGVERGLQTLNTPNLFVNTHPTELTEFGLLDSLRDLRAKFPDQPVTLEVHEAAVVNVEKMKELRAVLDELNFRLAFDDFGAGQSRLVELIDVHPDFVKFDIRLIRSIDSAPKRQQQMLASLVQMTRELAIVTLAEGVETEGEHETCMQLGFELGQGYYYGKPASAHENVNDPITDVALI
jgi:EAL domain-containing protein (putative c-di-GMP-specific phosphodiesterase class I)